MSAVIWLFLMKSFKKMIIVVILALGLILRLINLNQSLWLDEAVQALTSRGTFSGIFTELLGDFHPPFYHFLMYFWVRIFGSTEIALRMPSVLLGAGTVFLVYKIGKLGKLGKLGELAAIFLATSPFHLYYSQEVRMYAVSAFLVTGSFYFFLRDIFRGKENRKHWGNKGKLAYFLFTIVAIYTDYYAFFALLVQLFLLFLKKQYKTLLICLFAYLLIYLPWLPMFFRQWQTGKIATQILPEWGQLVNLSFFKALPLTLTKFFIGRVTIFNKKLYFFVVLGILGILGSLGVRAISKIREEKQVWGKVIVLWLCLPIIIAWLVSFFVPNYQPFRLLICLPAFYLLLA
ncbi:MAG: glycosyltransferase family 39 protein, partial [Patescibacteria group bacterium]|nr:glycosyltransferase family 39 protein [Patescibacteria group bacterium]